MSNILDAISNVPGKLERSKTYRTVNLLFRIFIIAVTVWPMLLIGTASAGRLTVTVGGGHTIFVVCIAVGIILILLFIRDYLKEMGSDRSTAVIVGAVFAIGILLLVMAVGHGDRMEIALFNGQIVVACLACVPFLVLIGIFLWNPLKIIGAYAVGNAAIGLVNLATKKSWLGKEYVPTPQKMFRWVVIGLIADGLLGIYLSLVPVSDDRQLILPLVLITVTLILLHAIKWLRGFRVLLTMAFWVITAIFCLGGRTQARETLSSMSKKLPSLSSKDSVPARNFSADYCTEDTNSVRDFRTVDPAPDQIEIQLQDGCLSGPFYLPDSWRSWRKQPVGHDPDWWLARKYPGYPIVGPVGLTANFEDGFPPKKIYLEGKKGTSIIFIREDH